MFFFFLIYALSSLYFLVCIQLKQKQRSYLLYMIFCTAVMINKIIYLMFKRKNKLIGFPLLVLIDFLISFAEGCESVPYSR